MVGGGEQLDDSGLVLAKNAYDTALNFYVVRGHHDRSHFGICRLQADLARAFAIEALERCFFATNQRNNDIPGIGDLGLLANDKVPVHDVIFDHGTPFDLQNKGIAATSEIAQRNRLAFFNRFQRAPRRDPSHQWKLLHLAIVYLILDRLRQLDNLNGTALIVAAANEAFFLESGNVLVHGGQRSELEAFANFFETWRVAVFGLKRHEVIENFFLPFGQSHVRASLLRIFSIGTLGERKANVKYDFLSFRVTFTARLQRRKTMQRYSKKESLATRSFLAQHRHMQDLLDRARRAGFISRQAEHPGVDSRRNLLVTPVFSNKTHPGGMVSSASARGPV